MTLKFNEYATCSWCGFKKLCKLEKRRFVCKACDIIHKGDNT